MKRVEVILGFLIVFSSIGNTSLVEITVDTDKDVYQVGENVYVYVTAYNPSEEQITLHFGISLHASYEMDQIYNWADNKGYFPIASSLVLNAGSSYSWDLIHGPTELLEYPLNVGLHSVVGQVLAS